MQMQEAEWLRRSWGDKSCDHPDFDKEYYGGMTADDYVCTQCGRELSRAQVDEIRARQSREHAEERKQRETDEKK